MYANINENLQYFLNNNFKEFVKFDMSKFKKKPNRNNGPKNRKQLRKEKRQEKKQRKHDYFSNKNKPKDLLLNPNNNNDDENLSTVKPTKTKAKVKFVDKQQKDIKKEKNIHKKLQRDMAQQRKKQLKVANEEEDRNIKHIEKQLHLHKRKSKSIPKSFASDGLDYLLEVCDPESMKSIAAAEQQFANMSNEFEDDFELITGKTSKNQGASDTEDYNSEMSDPEENENLPEIDEDMSEDPDENYESDDELHSFASEDENKYSEKAQKKDKKKSVDNNRGTKEKLQREIEPEEDDEIFGELQGSDSEESNTDDESEDRKKIKNKERKQNRNKKAESSAKSRDKKRKYEEESEDLDSELDLQEDDSDVDNSKNEVQSKNNKSWKLDKEKPTKDKNSVKNTNQKKQKMTQSEDSDEVSDLNLENSGDESGIDDAEDEAAKEDVWEDIYGRTRSKDGKVVSNTGGKYVPPALRAAGNNSTVDHKRAERLLKLRKQLKGLLNRVAASNMHSIASQIEEMYMSNSRNDMNETLTQLIFEALITPVLTPERLLMEYVLLVTILHANVGTEVGAYFLQTVVKKYDQLYNLEQPVENKELDNTVHIIAQLYNFKIFHSQLLYQILSKLSYKFGEKHVECILLVLKNVGFSLRKDDPVALKQLILDLQKKAVSASSQDARVKYMLDILLAIKNNNMSKIPNYDTTYSEHIKKLLKGFIRKGLYVTQLNISLEDLLKAEERGRWWIVGSAWTGIDDNKPDKNDTNVNCTPIYNQKLLDLARKQRMNTDSRRSIFCALMIAESYIDAFEKLLSLGLKNQQEREIIHVLLHCSLQEKDYNPYYTLLAQKFCEYDRKYQMMIRCSMWDKLKALTNCSAKQISILARLLIHLFLNQGLPISTLKVIQFSELDQVTLRLIRQVLLGILLHENEEMCLSVFEKVTVSPKLKMFRESLRLFIHHFLLRNLNNSKLSEENCKMITVRAKLVEKSLAANEKKFKF